MIPRMSKLITPILIMMAVLLAACSIRSDGEVTFAEDTAASSGFSAMPQVKFEMTGDKMAAHEALVESQPPLRTPAAISDPNMTTKMAAESVPSDGGDFTGPIAQLVTQERIIVRTVDMRIVVTDVSGTVDITADLAQELGGWVVSSNRSAKHRGFISIRVPADRLDQAIQRLRDTAVDVESEISSSRDVTDQYVDLRSRLKNQRATEVALLKLLDRATEVKDALKIHDSLIGVQENIEVLLGKINFIEQTAAFSLLNLTLELEAAELPSDAGEDQASGVGQFLRFRASFNAPEGIEDFLYNWDFGDGSEIIRGNRTVPSDDEGTRETATVTHVYHDERDSPYIVQFEITGIGEAGEAKGKDTLVVTITRVPTVEVFAGNHVIVNEGEEVELDGSFTRPAGITDVKYSWIFGDGSDPVEGNVADGVTNVVATHTYPNHRPFPFTARLTITAQSNAGEVEGEAIVEVRVLETEGWVISGWNLGEEFKTAVRSLSAAGQWGITGLIWLGIFSPVIAIVIGLGVMTRRRVRAGRNKSNLTSTVSDETT